MLDTDKFYDTLIKYFPEDRFEDLKKKLFVTATDLIAGESKIFHEGALIKPLLASSAVPGIFSPVSMQDSLFCDGGVTNNFPVEPLKIFCDHVVGVYVNPLEVITVNDINSTAALVERAYLIIRASATRSKFSDCDVLIDPPQLNHYRILDRSKTDVIFQLGYEVAKRKFQESVLT